MKRKLTAWLILLAIAVLLPVTVQAQETTLTTKVPSIHTLHIDIAGNGRVIVDGVPCKQTGNLQIPRGTTPQISVEPADGVVLKSAFLDGIDITQELCNGTHEMPQMCLDANLAVTFEAAPGIPQTGDSVPVVALCFTMVLSLAGVLCCSLLPSKRKI